MSADVEVKIFYGPPSWFKEQLGQDKGESLLDLVDELDEAKRRYTLAVEGQGSPPPDESDPQPELVVAESGDYATLNEHAITNFVSLIRKISPECLYLHNPPARVHSQLERVFATKVQRFVYPVVTKDVLVAFRDGFADHLVGQGAVRESLLAALYPLTTIRRSTPVVLMFYGPSGVGKTETAHFINGLLGGALLRKQFSMFHSEKFASYVFGGPHSEISFAHDLLDRESGVILVDEFDKANPIFHSAFYQLFDDGVFEDKNYRVKLGASLVICTSNYRTKDDIRAALGDALYSRFDALVEFASLDAEGVKRVIDRIVDERFSTLTAVEQEWLDLSKIKTLLHARLQNLGNVRKLGKLIDEVISLKLVRAMLEEEDKALPS